MQPNDMQIALEVLFKMKESLMESLVEELIRCKDDDASSFNVQEIEDRFAIRIANLNTLIATMQEPTNPFEEVLPTRVATNVYETTKNKLAKKLQELVEFVHPDDILHLSIVPTHGNKYLIVLATAE
ncbi:MAG: hypothetical protein HUU50_19555 [Candidatus Brocadiae bacterium]|nr:hypothetical protein [Candidatus Brocadiia bacterium]